MFRFLGKTPSKGKCWLQSKTTSLKWVQEPEVYLKAGPTNPPTWLDLSNTACSILVTVFILSLKGMLIQVFYAGTWAIIPQWDSRSPKSQLVWVTAHKQELLNCHSNYQEPGQIPTGEHDIWRLLQKMTLGAKSWPKFKKKPTNFMKEKSISRWEKAPYQKSKAWKKLGQVSPKDAPFYHSLWVYILTNKLVNGVKETFLPQVPVTFVVQRGGARSQPLTWGSSHSPHPGTTWSCSLSHLHEMFSSTVDRLQTQSHLGLCPGWIETILIRYGFCTDPYCVPIKCGLFTTAVLVCTYNSFLHFLKTNEDPCKTKGWLGHMETPQITHRRQGLWQGFPHHHTRATWNKRKATFACCQAMG